MVKLSICLGEDNIQAVLGKSGRPVRIKECRRFGLRKGALLNDVIADERSVREALLQISDIYPSYRKNVHLVMGSSQILTRIMQTPMLPRRALLEISKRELDNFYHPVNRDLIYDYSVISRGNGGNRGQTVLCAAMERGVACGYTRLFAECGLKVKTINIALNSMSWVIEGMRPFLAKTFIFAVVEGRTMLSSLYVDGVYVYTSRVRLVSERRGEETIDELVANLSAIVRFHSSRRLEYEIEHIYICGLDEGEEGILFPKIRESIAIEVEKFDLSGLARVDHDRDFRLRDYIFPLGNLLEG